MNTLERKLANKIADHWYNELHMQHKPIFQKQKLADFVETELKTLGLFSVSGMLPDDKTIAQVACDEGQQDWNDIRHQKTYIDAFIDGAKYMRTAAF